MSMSGPVPDGTTGMPRSVYERMTSPTPADMAGVAAISDFSPVQVKMIVEKVLLESLRRLAGERDDFDVAITTDSNGWSVRIDLA